MRLDFARCPAQDVAVALVHDCPVLDFHGEQFVYLQHEVADESDRVSFVSRFVDDPESKQHSVVLDAHTRLYDLGCSCLHDGFLAPVLYCSDECKHIGSRGERCRSTS